MAGGIDKAEVGGLGSGQEGKVELGLYGMRTELRVMKDLEATLGRLKQEMEAGDVSNGGAGGASERPEGDVRPVIGSSSLTDR